MSTCCSAIGNLLVTSSVFLDANCSPMAAGQAESFVRQSRFADVPTRRWPAGRPASVTLRLSFAGMRGTEQKGEEGREDWKCDVLLYNEESRGIIALPDELCLLVYFSFFFPVTALQCQSQLSRRCSSNLFEIPPTQFSAFTKRLLPFSCTAA